MNQNILNEYYVLIKDYVLRSRFNNALESIGKLLKTFPKCEFAYYYKGVCEFAKEDYDESIKSYLSALKLNPANPKAYFNLGVSYYNMHEYDNALINIGKALIIFSKLKELDNKKRCVEALKIIEIERRG